MDNSKKSSAVLRGSFLKQIFPYFVWQNRDLKVATPGRYSSSLAILPYSVGGVTGGVSVGVGFETTPLPPAKAR